MIPTCLATRATSQVLLARRCMTAMGEKTGITGPGFFMSWTASPRGMRSFATASTDPEPASGYLALKKAAKERRRELWNYKVERKERLKTRRKWPGGDMMEPRRDLRREFRSWFITKKVDEEYMDRKARQAQMTWKLRVAVILQRPPVVLPDRPDWRVQYENLRAHLDQYGKQYPKELFGVDYDAPRARTYEELLALLPKGFTPAPRETVADATGEVHTTDRKLKDNLFLLVQENPTGPWQLPTVALQAEETFLEAAKRALKEKVGSEVEYWCPSNCPCAVDMVRSTGEDEVVADPEKAGNIFYGTKTFFMKVEFDQGSVSEKRKSVHDYAWLDRDEVVQKIKADQGEHPAKFYRYVL